MFNTFALLRKHQLNTSPSAVPALFPGPSSPGTLMMVNTLLWLGTGQKVPFEKSLGNVGLLPGAKLHKGLLQF